MDDSSHKSQLRLQCKAIRAQIHTVTRENAALALLMYKHLLQPFACVGGYVPMRDEMDVMPLLEALHQDNHTIALPCIVAQDQPLIFRTWQPGQALIAGRFRTLQPAENAKQIEPDVLLVPLLAFDNNLHRLGYGGGFYDRTIAALRVKKPKIQTIGVAFDAQMVDMVPTEAHDMPLDCIISEKRKL